VSQSLLNKIWSFLAVVLLYLSLNVWSITQQWQLSLPGNPFKDGKTTPFGVALYGVLLCGPLLIVVCIIVHLYATRSTEKKWQDRFPRFGDFALDTSRPEATAFQLIALFLFLLLPLAGIGHFQNKMLNGSVFEKQEPCPQIGKPCLAERPVISGWREMLFHAPRVVNASRRLVYDPDLSKDIAPSFVPIWEPWTFLILSLVAICFAIWSLLGVFQPPYRKHRKTR
jgi:hypothetical protein